MDRLTSIDASFLAQEKKGSHMHIGAMMIFEGPAPSHEDFCRHISERLHLVSLPPEALQMGGPLWTTTPA